METPTKRFWVLALLAALLMFPSLLRRGQGLAGYDDAYFAHEAKEMVRTGDWWSVRFNGEFILAHPPVFQWMEASSFSIFGVHDGAAKFPSVLLGFATILLMYFLTLELTADAWLSLLAMLVLATTQFFLKNAGHAMTDVPFTFFFALTLFCYVKGLKQRAYLLALALPLALALLTRSVVGLAAGGIIIGHIMLTKRFRLLISPWLISGFTIGVALAAGWYTSQYKLHGAAFFSSHLQFLNSKLNDQHVPRSWAAPFTYPLALLKYYWPWLPFLIGGLVLAVRRAWRVKDSTATLLLLWVVLIIVPFSFADTRYPRYIMAVFPALSVLSAMALNQWLPLRRRDLFFKFACGVLGVAVIATLLFPPKPRADDIRQLAPIADANTAPGDRVLVYTYEDGRTDYEWQLLWYTNRYTRSLPTVKDLVTVLSQGVQATVIVDKATYGKLRESLPDKTLDLLGESRNLVCFRTR